MKLYELRWILLLNLKNSQRIFFSVREKFSCTSTNHLTELKWVSPVKENQFV